jgi:hypothetical protein
MNSEEILIEFVANGDRANGESIKSISTTKVKDSIQRIANLVQQLATASSASEANALALDEVEIAIKLTEAGEAVLLGDGQSNGAITLRFRRPSSVIPRSVIPSGETPNVRGELSPPTPSLISKAGVNYTKLQVLLSNSRWQEADQETWNVMCQAARKNVGSVFSAEDIKQVSCDDLQIIDNLWQQYSQGRFGFSTQNQIYTSSILG